VAALALPVLTGIALMFIADAIQAFVVSLASVIVSSILVAIDAHRLGSVDLKGRRPQHPGTLLLEMWLLWIVFYPYAFFRRRRFGRPNFAPAGIVAPVLMFGLPIARWSLVPPGLPSCTSPQVMQVVAQVTRSAPHGDKIRSIDGYRQVSYDADAQRRQGQCVLHMEDGDLLVDYIVEWQDREQRRFQVRTAPAELPACTNKDVIAALERTLRALPVGAKARSIDGHHEVRYDRAWPCRYGQCVVHGDDGDFVVNYLVKWRDRWKGLSDVIVLRDLPACDSGEVIDLVDATIRKTIFGPRAQSIGGHHEVRYDPVADRRYGECVLKLPDGEILMTYIVEWSDNSPERRVQVRTFPAELPSCTSVEVIQILDKVIRELPAGCTAKSIDGHREVSYDRIAERRYGKCVLHTDAGEVEFDYLVEWQDHERGLFRVRAR
jgi:hypothetical protein